MPLSQPVFIMPRRAQPSLAGPKSLNFRERSCSSCAESAYFTLSHTLRITLTLLIAGEHDFNFGQ